MLFADLHIHTAYSKDGDSSVREILDAAVSCGLDVIALTDHDSILGWTEALTLQSEYPDLVIIPGIEISTAQGHLLGIGITHSFEPGLDIFESIAQVHADGGITILPHPYHRYRHGAALKCREAMAAVDAIEAYNSRYIFGNANMTAAKKAKRLHKPIVAGSDAHQARFVGYGLTYIDAERSIESVLSAIRAGKTKPAGKKTPIRVYTKQSLRNSWRKIRSHIPRKYR